MSNEQFPRIVLIVGGVGGAKLAYGLARIMPAEDLTIIVNTGDDFWLYGLRICPDLDTITYTLADVVNKEMGWGRAGDTDTTLKTLASLGDEPWFRLGDKDLATHMLRTQWLSEGLSLTEITARLSSALGILCRILPMTNHEVATKIESVEYGELGFQTYFVKHRWQPTVTNISFNGLKDAELSREVIDAIKQADALIIGPSNPWLSINPVISVAGMRELIENLKVPRIAVTPIIAGDAVKGPTAKIMRELRYEVSARTVCSFYDNLIDGFVADERDQDWQIDQVRLLKTDTLMDSEQKRIMLATNILNWLKNWK